MTSACSRSKQLDPRLLDAIRRGPAAVERTAPVIEVPFAAASVVPIINVFVDGHGPYRFLFDAGGNVTSIRQSVARAIHSDVRQTLRTRNVVALHEIRFGACTLRDVMAVGEPELDVDGVIGFNGFRDGLLTIDFPHRLLRFESGSLPPANGLDVVDYELRDRMPYIAVSLAGKSYWCNLDTGASGGLIVAAKLADTLPLAEPLHAGPALWNQAEGKIPTRVSRLRGAVQFGSIAMSDPVVMFSGALDSEQLLGSGLLQPFAVTFDFAHHRVRFARGDIAPASTIARP
jgi:predicted aspartyl protease